MAPKSFRYTYPKNKRIAFDGGLNNKFDKQIILDNESPDCLNVIFGNRSVETRGGTTQVNTAAIGSFCLDGLYTRHDNDGTETMTAWGNGTLWFMSGTTFSTIPSAQSVYTAGVRVGAVEYENYIFYGNGNSIPYKYNGAEFTRHGVYPPTTTSTVATAPTGTGLTGDYQYKVTFVNSGLVESDVGPVTATWTAANENARLTSIPVAPTSYGVNSRYLYRTEASGTVFKRLATISDNTTTTYDDAISDSSLGDTAPTDQGLPPNWKTAVYHQARLFFIDPATNYVKYTEIGNPYVVKVENFRPIGDNTGDIPKCLSIFDNSLVILCRNNSAWIIYMPDADDSNWVNIRVRATLGSNSPFAPFYYNNKIMFAAIENNKFVGFAALSGDTINPSATLLTVSATKSDYISNKIEDEIDDIQSTYLDNITSIVHKNKAYISVTSGAGETINNRILYFDFSNENISDAQDFLWSPWDGINATQFCIYDGDLYYATSDAVGLVYQMNTSTYNDNGSAIDSYYWTKEFSGLPGHEEYHKDFRFIHLLHELSGSYYMGFWLRLDSSLGVGFTDQIDLTPDTSLYGTAVYGLSVYGVANQTFDLEKSIGQFKGKRIQFKFSNQNTLNQKFKCTNLSFEYNLRGIR